MLETVSGYRSSTEPRLGDRHLDKFMAFVEAIYWRKVDQGQLQHVANARLPFQEPGYWAKKNTRFETSRDRYMSNDASASIAELEAALAALGYGPAYVGTIRERATKGERDAYSLHVYQAALKRTLESKQEKLQPAMEGNPF